MQDENKKINDIILSKDQEKYELTFLNYSYLNDEVIQEFITKCEQKFNKEEFCVLQNSNIGRYDISYKKKKIKINMYTIIFIAKKDKILAIKIIVQKNKSILKSLLIKNNYQIIKKLFDYKYPIEMKKYMFESMRIMPIELTRCNAKEQKLLGINIQRARNLGLMDRVK